MSDCGCGMRLLRSSINSDDLTNKIWDEIAYRIKQNKGKPGDLGGGNHFLDALLPYDEDQLYFLVHTGSRKESGGRDTCMTPFLFFTKEEWEKKGHGL